MIFRGKIYPDALPAFHVGPEAQGKEMRLDFNVMASGRGGACSLPLCGFE